MARKTNKVLNTTEEEISNILPENLDLMEEFLDYLETTDRSQESIRIYKNNLNIFFVYCLRNLKNKDFVNIKKRDIMNFQNFMVKNGLSPARIKNIKSTLSSLSNFIETILDEDDKWSKFKNIINKIPSPVGEPTREKTVLEDSDCQKLLDYLVENKKYQQACIFALAWSSGRRKSELLRIKKSYIAEENLIYGSLYKTPEKIKTKGRGNKGKMLNVYILKNKFKKYFDLWIEERERLGVPQEIDDLFVTRRNGEWKPISASSLNSYAKSFGEFLGVDFYFHLMRHQFTTALHQANVPANVIKDLIGWESLEMVSLYTDVEIDDEIGKYFSEGGIKKVDSKSLSEL